MAYRHHNSGNLLKKGFPPILCLLPSTEGETVRASNNTIDLRCDGSCLMVEARSALVAGEAPRWPLGWSVSLRLLWQSASPLAAGREAAVKPGDSVTCLFSEEGSSPDLCLFSPTTSRSLCLGGAGLACYYCRRVGRERAGLKGPA